MATLTDTFVNQAGLRDGLREAVGHLNDTVLLPDGMLDRLLARALDRFNRDWAEVGLGTFLTVADQQSYSPLPATGYKIKRVYWPMDRRCILESANLRSTLGELAADSGLPIDEHGTRALADPSMVNAAIRRTTWLRKLDPRGVEIHEGVTVYLDPIPDVAGTSVTFSYWTARYDDVMDIADTHRTPFFTLANAMTHESLSSGAGGIERVEDGVEGTVIVTKAPAHHMALARQKEKDYQLMRKPLRWKTFP